MHLSATQILPDDPPLRMSQVSDGVSCTFLISEKRINANRIASKATNSLAQPGDQYGCVSGFGPDTVRTALFPPWPDYPRERTIINWGGDGTTDSTGQISVRDGFGSSHLHGFNALFLDGSVRHLRFEIDYHVFQYLSHRSDGQAIDMSKID
jgi:prepilin-type processing-associated H-X9-DG protein